MQSAEYGRPTCPNAGPPLQLRDEFDDGQVGLARDQGDQAIRDLAVDRGDVAPSPGPRGNVPCLAVPAEHAADGRATNAEQRRDLLVAEVALVEGPDDRFPQLSRSGHSNRRSQFSDHIKRVAG